MKQMRFFGDNDHLKELTEMGDPIEKMLRVIDFEIFHPILVKAFKKDANGPGRGPPYDCVLCAKFCATAKTVV